MTSVTSAPVSPFCKGLFISIDTHKFPVSAANGGKLKPIMYNIYSRKSFSSMSRENYFWRQVSPIVLLVISVFVYTISSVLNFQCIASGYILFVNTTVKHILTVVVYIKWNISFPLEPNFQQYLRKFRWSKTNLFGMC